MVVVVLLPVEVDEQAAPFLGNVDGHVLVQKVIGDLHNTFLSAGAPKRKDTQKWLRCTKNAKHEKKCAFRKGGYIVSLKNGIIRFKVSMYPPPSCALRHCDFVFCGYRFRVWVASPPFVQCFKG